MNGFLLAEEFRLAQIEQGTVRLPVVIDDFSTGEFLDEFYYLVNLPKIPEIRVEILSNGGDCTCAFGIYDVIYACPKPVIGIGIGFVASAAAMVVLQACTERLSYEHTRFLVHEVEQTYFGQEKLGAAEDNTKEIAAIQDIVLEILAARTGQTKQELHDAIHRRDHWMSAQQALEFHLIDRII